MTQVAATTDVTSALSLGPVQPPGLKTHSVDAGHLNDFIQLGQRPSSFDFTHVEQNVHSNEQMSASVESAAQIAAQHS